MRSTEALQLLWRRKLIVLVVLAVVLGTSFFLVSRQAKVYESRATVALLPDTSTPGGAVIYANVVPTLLATYDQLLSSQSFLGPIARDLPGDITPGELKGAIHGDPLANNIGVLRVVAHAKDPDRARVMAQGTATAFVRSIASNGVVVPKVIDAAQQPDGPVSPRPKLVLMVAFVVGLALGLGAAFAWERLFGRVNTSRELAEASGLPVLAVLPDVRALRTSRRIVVGDPELSAMEEGLRALRTNFLFTAQGLEKGHIMITGLNPGDGKSTVTANLATIIAELGFSVLLIDADVHRPVQHEIFDLRNTRGLTSTVLSGAEPASLLQKTQYPNLHVVTSGPQLTARSQELSLYLQQLPRFTNLAEMVLVDSPPLRAADDIRLLAAFSAGVVLLLKSGVSSARQVHAGVGSLQVLGARVLGSVLTMSDEHGALSPAGDYYTYRMPEPGSDLP